MKNTALNETDIIDWTGEALEFLMLPQTQVEALCFVDVVNGEAAVPCGLQSILNISRNNGYEAGVSICLEASDTDATTEVTDTIPFDYPTCNGAPLFASDLVQYHRDTFSVNYAYSNWTTSNLYTQTFTPVKLASVSYYDTIVCREKFQEMYQACEDEYSIVGITTKLLRFSFDEGQVAISYLKTAIDEETGYPLIPDDISYITAITYYVKWKIFEWRFAESESGASSKMQYFEGKWLKYVRQAKAGLRFTEVMEQNINMLNQSHKMNPVKRGYQKYFGSIGKFSKTYF